MNKIGITVLLVAALAGLITLYPQHVVRLMFSTVIQTNVLVLKYWHNVSTTEQSLESIAFEQILRRFRDFTPPDHHTTRRNMKAFGSLLPIGPSAVDEFNITTNNGSTVIPLYWITSPTYNVNKTIIVYLHGGAYVAGSFTSHSGFVAELGRRADAKVLFIEYRLAPEHTFPAMVDDAITAYKWLIYDQKISAKRIVFAGDSAGGGLVLLTLFALQDEGKGTIPLPAAAVTMSAWTDLSLDRPSYQENAHTDALVSEPLLLKFAALATETELEDRAARKSQKFSPIFSPANKFAKLPPLYMSVGSVEVLLDDTVHFAGKAIQAGADVKLVVAPHMQHVFPYFHPYVPESTVELEQVAQWIKKRGAKKV